MQIGLDWTAGGGFEQKKKWFSNQCAMALSVVTLDGRKYISRLIQPIKWLSEEPELEVLPSFWYPLYKGDSKLYVN